MTLTYRGIHTNGSQAPVSLGVVGSKYRGLDWRFRHLSKPAPMATTLNLKYRGVDLVPWATTAAPVSSPVQAEMGVPSLAIEPTVDLSVAAIARNLMTGHQRNLKIRQQTMLYRSAANVGPLDNLSEYWNRIQGKVHPTFRDTLDRSNATMS